MTAGDQVRVRNAKREVAATLLHVAEVERLPSMPCKHFDDLKQPSARRLLEAWGVRQVALLNYRYQTLGGMMRSKDFYALEIGGRWFTVKREPLTIEAMAPDPVEG